MNADKNLPPAVGAAAAEAALQRRANLALLKRLAAVAVGMFAFGYALVPFYDKICEVTGLREIAQADVVRNTQVDATRSIRIELDSNLRNLPWTFKALEPVLDVHPGEVRRMPVVFVVDPAAPAELSTITLSYTFFEVEGVGG